MKKIKNKIFFSFVLCCYNSEKFLELTLDSIINQTFKNWELIIIDDGSTDNTRNIIKEYQKKNRNLIYFYKINSGYADSRNLGIDKSNGEWIAFIDHDDICLPKRLEFQYNDIIKNPNCFFFFSDAYLINHKYHSKHKIYNENFSPNLSNNKLKKNQITRQLLNYGCFVSSSTVVVKKNIIQKYKFNNKYEIIADYELFCRMSKNYDFYSSKQKLIKWNNSQSSLSMLKKRKEKLELINLLFYNLKDQNFKFKILIIYKIFINFIQFLIKR